MKFNAFFVALIFPFIAPAQQPEKGGVAGRVDSLLEVVSLLTNENDLEGAIAAVRTAESLTSDSLGTENIIYGNVCSAYGKLLFDQEDLPKAKEWFLRSLELKRKFLGRDHVACVNDLISLGLLYLNFGDFMASEPLMIEAKNIAQAQAGKTDMLYVRATVNLSNIYAAMGEVEKVEPLLLEVKEMFDSGLLDKKHIGYAICLNNLGNHYTGLRLFQKAEPLLIQGAEIVKNDFGEDHPEYARRLGNLANLYLNMYQFKTAEPLLIQAKNILEKAERTDPSLNAFIIGNIGYLYMMLGELDKAEPFLEQALRIEENWSGHQHYETALRRAELAELNFKKGAIDKAETLYLEALSVLKAALGKDHKSLTSVMRYVADLYWSVQKISKASPLLEESCKGEQTQILKAAQYLSERELSEHLNSFAVNQSKLFSFSLRQSALDELCYDNALFYKGFLLNFIQQMQRLTSQNPTSAKKIDAIKSLHRRLARQYDSPLAERDSAAITDLEQQVNTLEKELARDVTGYGEAVRQVRWQEIQAALKPGEVAIEFVDYQYFDPKYTDSVMYAAIVLRPLPAENLLKEGGDAQPQFIPLFEKKELLPLLRGATGGNNFYKINALYASKPAIAGQKSAYELIWKPLEPYLSGTSTVYCASSGLLHYLNLAAIPAADGKPFGDSRQLVLLGSTRSLAIGSKPSQLASSSTSNYAYVAGGIRYETDSTAISFVNGGLVSRAPSSSVFPLFQPDSSATRGGALEYLPATATEVREIGAILRAANVKAQVDTGFYATEEVVRSLGFNSPSPQILHLATHGYFFPEPSNTKTPSAAPGESFKLSEHPMIRSGLILAGANEAWLTGKHPPGQEDGILTAYEISQMNLNNTELVVLSACETGLGKVSGNEGVYGLQRAFKIAGAKYLIMSLWKVNDQSTKAFMTEFYRQWLVKNLQIPQAFRAAQQAIRAQKPNPYDWAGFVLIE